MDKNKLIQYIEDFKNKKILVIGDIMLDKYIHGNVTRISPEAPVQIVNVKEEKYVPGGAGNSANNIASLGGQAFISGLVGEDNEKSILIQELQNKKVNPDGVFTEQDRPTIVKTRVMAMTQQLLRIDYEKKHQIKEETIEKITDYVKTIIPNIDAVIISDYCKGMNSEKLIKQIIEICNQNNKLTIIDTKSKDYLMYKNCTLIAPNHIDAASMTKIDENHEEDLTKIGKRFQQDLNCNVLITRGKKGMTIFEKESIKTIPTKAKEVYDVSGAGDTVVAALTLALCSGATLEESAILATYAASIVISKLGTAVTTIDEIKKVIENER